MKDELKTEMQEEMSFEEFFACAVYGAIRGGETVEEACKRFGITLEEWRKKCVKYGFEI